MLFSFLRQQAAITAAGIRKTATSQPAAGAETMMSQRVGMAGGMRRAAARAGQKYQGWSLTRVMPSVPSLPRMRLMERNGTLR